MTDDKRRVDDLAVLLRGCSTEEVYQALRQRFHKVEWYGGMIHVEIRETPEHKFTREALLRELSRVNEAPEPGEDKDE